MFLSCAFFNQWIKWIFKSLRRSFLCQNSQFFFNRTLNMKPLVEYRRVSIWLGAYPIDENEPKWMKFTYMLYCFYSFLMNLVATISSLAFFLKNVSVDLEVSLYTLLQITASGCGTYACGFLFFSQNRVTKMLEDLTDIYNECKLFFFSLLFE